MRYLSIAALVATASASVSVFNLNATADASKPKVKVINRCSYDVHLWSVLKGQGCPASESAVLKPGQFYQENYRTDGSKTGVSIKLSRTSQCGGDVDITQLEYFIETSQPGYNYNYLDVSYVDCGNQASNVRNKNLDDEEKLDITKGNAPTKQEGYYLKVGNENGKFLTAGADRAICPVQSCNNAAECAKISYINPNDKQTKSCDPNADMIFYMCGGQAPGEEVVSAPSSSSSSSSSSDSSSQKEQSKSTPAKVVAAAAAAAVTPAPVRPADSKVMTKLEVVYVTKYEYVNMKKRHVHGHRHPHFRA